MTAELPLGGLKVIEIAQLASGPYCAALLAALGAEVLKIEPPTGDLARTIPPFSSDRSVFFEALNHGKSFETVDLNSDDGQARIDELLKQSDILVENMSARAAVKLGLDPQRLRARYPQLVVCALTAFGREGAERDRIGVDLIFQAETGMMSVTGSPDGPPLRAGTNIPDLFAGAIAAIGALAALRSRDVHGTGRAVDVTLIEATLTVQSTWFSTILAGMTPRRLGNDSPYSAPNGTFCARDGDLAIAIVGESQWQRFCALLGIDPTEANFATNELRCRNRTRLRTLIEDLLSERDAAEWVTVLNNARLPAALVKSYPEVVSERPELFEEQGDLLLVRSPFHFS